MEYDICHELWLSPNSMLPTLGFMCCMVDICCTAFWGGINYRIWVFISCNGGQGGEFNASWETWVSIPKLGLAQRYGSFVIILCELCLVLWSAL